MKWILPALALACLASGCTITLSGREMHRRVETYAPSIYSGVYEYAGTKHGHHYFWKESKLKKTDFLRVRASDFTLTNEFKFTRIRSNWVPLEQVAPYTFDGFQYFPERTRP